LAKRRGPEGPLFHRSEAPLQSAEDLFFARSENFAELKFQLLHECAIFYGDVFLRALQCFVTRLLDPARNQISSRILDSQAKLFKSVDLTYRTLVEPIREGLIGSNSTISYQCNCGGQVEWHPPHNDWDNYCPECGAQFVMHEVPGEVEYVISAAGVGDVTGGAAVKIPDLPPPLREKLTRISQKHKAPTADRSGVSFLYIKDLENVDEDTLQSTIRVVGVASPEVNVKCQLFAFVSGNALKRNKQFPVRCNCGETASYDVSSERYVVLCNKCGSLIGLIAVSGNSKHVSGKGSDGAHCEYPIQGA
jgi:DNA-directed RNA polymerase subunit RPC12/RpoP